VLRRNGKSVNIGPMSQMMVVGSFGQNVAWAREAVFAASIRRSGAAAGCGGLCFIPTHTDVLTLFAGMAENLVRSQVHVGLLSHEHGRNVRFRPYLPDRLIPPYGH